MSTSISLVKRLASIKTAGGAGTKVLRALGKGANATVHAAAEGGAGVGRAVGAGDDLGRAAGILTLGAGGIVAGKKGKTRYQQWKYQHNFR